MTWLITGGAGYIGAHVARDFVAAGKDVLVLDSLASGKRSFVGDLPFVHKDLLDKNALADVFSKHPITGVVHLAGFKYAGESVQRPIHTYRQNVEATINLLDAMAEHGVKNLVFSSSAAVFGTPRTNLVTEDTPTSPESPYGESKLIGEWLIAAQAKAAPLNHVSLRYFNVVGSKYPEVFDTSPYNLFPKIFDMLLSGQTPIIFGSDYDTPDGTAVRDYVDVGDISAAHLVAAKRLEAGKKLEAVYNLGSGSGTSVAEIMDAMREVTGVAFDPEIGPRRAGDPDRIVASGEKAARDLDWRVTKTLAEMVKSAWNARENSK
ncbi:MAG: UDP-glucose 4-epimerase GalE [Microbacteriaceae bacterium]|nr:UDP-glucose 4-epimerase GalE [Microbacteriaceae bacterium]